MKLHEIKFSFYSDLRNKTELKEIFEKIDKILNIRFDNNLKPYHHNNPKNYEEIDVSKWNSEQIENEIKTFFNYSFDEIIDNPLYKFLVLKNNDNLKILANINSLIFDYPSINKIYNLFNNLDNSEDNILNYDNEINKYFTSPEFKNDKSYWNNHLSNIGNYVKFHNIKTDNYNKIQIPLTDLNINNFIKEHNITKLNFITSIFSLYLSRIDQTEGCLLKTNFPHDENDIGPFDKNTILKIEYTKNQSFIEYIAEITNEYDLANEHTKADIENYVENISSYYSIYDLTNLNDITVKNEENSALTMNLYEDYLDLRYNTDLFPEIYIQYMAENIKSLIKNVINSPNQIIKDINILSEKQQDLLSDLCKGKPIEVDLNKTFSRIFRENARDNPHAIAVDDGINQVTYGELEKSTNSLAYDLCENYDLEIGNKVALMLPRTYHFPELVLTLNKIGCAFIPIDLLYPIKRIEYMLNIAQADAIITTKEIAENYDFKTKVIYFEDLKTDLDIDFDIVGDHDTLFSIIFTSGTTGLPKGVMITNKHTIRGIAAFKDIFNISYGDVGGCYLSFSFVGSFLIYVIMAIGGCSRIFNEKEQKDSLLLIKDLKEKPMNNIILPPSVAVPILENEDIPLDYLVVAGAKLNELTKKDRHTKLVNFYGTSETILGTTKIYDLNDIQNNNVPIGNAVGNSWVYILDENGMQLPMGVPGEICISGLTGKGYINNPELTAKSFVENPYSDCEDNKIMYRTGDIGFYNFEGEIEILGREDDQLSIRGFRVESNEILKIMKSFDNISEIYLDVDNDTLIAYYTTHGKIDIENVKEALRNEIPPYMIPSLFVELEKIPLNPNGKIDKIALKKIFNKKSEVNIEDEVLVIVIDAFKEILNQDIILMDDNFIELGGSSLSAMKLQILLKEKLGVNLYASDILELLTPTNIANHIKFNLNTRNDLNVNYTFDDLCPLSESQLNVYLDDMVNEMGTGYNNPFKIEFNNNYSVEDIKQAIDKLMKVIPILTAKVISDHEILSFSFDAKPPVIIGSMNDIESFVQPFKMDEYLSRFLIVENNGTVILCADFHHLIFDGTSVSIILNQLISVLNGNDVNVIDDGVLRQISFEESVSEEYMEEAHKFFDEMLADIDEIHDLLPSIHMDHNSDYEYIDTINLENDSLNLFLQNNHLTPNQFFTSVFAYTLSRFTGSSKVLFNLIEDGRMHIDLSDSVGMYVRTLPLLIDCANQKVSSFLKNSSNLVSRAMKYDLYPFRLLATEFGVNSDISFQYSHNLFYHIINKEELNYAVDELDHDINGEFSFYIFNMNENKMGIKLLYSDKYSYELIKRFVDTFKLILQEITKVEMLSDFNYIYNDDVALLDSYNQTQHDLKYKDILDAFNDNLAQYPDNKLVSYNDTNYSYSEGAYIINEISKQLIELGSELQDTVAFLVERSELYLFSVLSILSVGGIYVPLDDAHPDERIEFILNDTNSKVVIVSDETYERAKNLINEDVTLLNVSNIVNSEIGTLTSLPTVYGNLLCILYTSGTTGIPKGVKITRKSILNLSEFYMRKYGLTQDDVYALFASIGFDVAMKAIFPSICAGACLTIIPDEFKLNMDAMNKYFIKHDVTHTEISTQVAKLYINQIENSPLKVLTTGGEKLGDNFIDVDYRFVDSYGPTEACVDVTCINVNDRIDSSSIGHLLDNVKAYVLDDEERRVPVGAVGELYLAGISIAEGYLNRQEENSKVFLRNPFEDNEDYGIMYRTGDMVRVLPDGSFGIVGRRDSQVKIRGNRVELGEIESVIRELDYIEDVTIQTIKNGDNYELVAYVVTDEKCDDNKLQDYIYNHVSEIKPDYMIPSFVISLDVIPLTVNGKVNKHALPEVDLNSLKTEYVAPETEMEKHVVNAFEVVFNQNNIGLNDDFVRLGGDSIMAIRVLSLLEKNNISCTARDILNYKTPYLIAQNIQIIDKISYEATEGEIDLLPIQSYFFDKINANEYSQEFILKSKIKLDLNTLQKAFDELTNVHDMLRATYKVIDDEVVQEILPLNTRVCHIEEYTCDDLTKSIGNIVKEFINSLDISKELIKIGLVHFNEECYVVLVIHHLIIDGVSWSILIDDLTYIYKQLNQNKEIELLRPYPYKSWIEDVKSLVEDISDEEKQHWTDVDGLLDESVIEGKSKSFNFDVNVSFDIDNLLTLSEEEFLALSIARAYKKTYGEDIIFNRESYGRDESLANVGKTIGWFTSQFPILVNVNNGHDNISLMNDVYSLKESFRGVNHLGLNYASLIYITNELEYKHCPVTFNFLSTEFSFGNELFETINKELISSGELEFIDYEHDTFGIDLNVSRVENSYIFSGDYAEDTYLGDKFNNFVDNIKEELEFIANYKFDNIVCYLSESQLGVYLDEKIHDKGTAYSVSGIFECDDKYSIDEIKNAINILIDRHPILKGRILETDKLPLLVCDSYPEIEMVEVDDYSELIKPFDWTKGLSRFFIVDNDNGKVIGYDMHHMISDATSTIIIDNELDLALNGKLDDSADLGFVYASRDSFESRFESHYELAYEFFNQEFADIDEVQTLLSDVDGSMGSVSLPIRGVRDNVESFVRENGITISNFLNAIFAYTYSRFTGSDKVYYTFTENGRHEDYTQNALSMFVRTIPILVDCSDKTVVEYLDGVSDLILESMSNRSYPFRLLANEFNLTNDITFEYNYDLNDASGIGNDIVFRDETDRVAEFLCVVNDIDDGYLVTVNHLDIFSQDTAERFVKVYKEVLIQFLEKENLGDINYISNKDSEMLNDYNQTKHSLDYEDILDAFNDSLSRYPDNKIVSYNDNSYTYGQGAFITDKIAKKLLSLNVEPGDCVGFLVPRSELYLFSFLGIMSMGGVYVPLDDKLPDERIKFMIDDTESKVIIVSNETKERVSNLNSNCTILNLSDIITSDVGSLSSLPVTYSDLACILYTSGTTGIPKGVKITRKSVLNVSADYVDKFDLNNNEIYGLFSSIGFDVSNFVIAAVLYCGACLCVVPEEIRLNMIEMNKYFIEHDVTHTFITTQVGKLFMETVEDTSLKVLLVAGEKLGEVENPDNYILVDAFGPTEAFAFVSSIKNIDKIDPSSIGFLNYNTKAYILDNEGRRVPRGAVGELYLAGNQIANGYLNREDETEHAFVNNPFDKEYDMLYRTGDLVRMLPDGSLGIVGRRDGQVKIRGNRVELSEVEGVIRELNYIEDVTVQTIKNGTNNELVAYVVVSDGADVENIKDNICGYVSKHKPDYMIPTFVIKLDKIPLNVNSKVDKRALPKVDVSSLHADYVAPRNEKEKYVVEAFENAFNQENISIYDDFMHLGGDSLIAIRLLSQLENYNITIADIFTLRTPEAIANSVNNLYLDFDLDIYSLDSGFPLNWAQVNVLADILVCNKMDSYSIPNYMIISKEHSIDDIINAIHEIIRVHPLLGMCLKDFDDIDENKLSFSEKLKNNAKLLKTSLKQMMNNEINIGMIKRISKSLITGKVENIHNSRRKRIMNLININNNRAPYLVKGNELPILVESDYSIERLIEFYSQHFDLYNNLSKFLIIEMEDSYFLLSIFHHLIFDAISYNIFTEDFQRILNGEILDVEDSFLKVAAFSQQIQNTEEFTEANDYYETLFSKYPDIGDLKKDSSGKGFSMKEFDFELDLKALKSFLRKLEISENIFFTSFFAYALSKFTDTNTVQFNIIENGRDRFNNYHAIGMFSNVLAVLANCENTSIESFIKETSSILYNIVKYNYYPFMNVAMKNNLDSGILYQYLPNWIEGEYDSIKELLSQEDIDNIFDNLDDDISNFFIQVFQKDDSYKLIIMHSNKYSDEMANNFAETYMSLLSKIIYEDISSNLNDVL